MVAAFMLPTRVHERYLFPAVVCAMVLWAVAPRFRWCAIWLSAAAFLNVFMSFTSYVPRLDTSALQDPALFRVVALANVGAFVALVVSGFRHPPLVESDLLPALTQRTGAMRPGVVGRMSLIVLVLLGRADVASRIEPDEPEPAVAETDERQDDPMS
jgi:hypothetical protein